MHISSAFAQVQDTLSCFVSVFGALAR